METITYTHTSITYKHTDAHKLKNTNNETRTHKIIRTYTPAPLPGQKSSMSEFDNFSITSDNTTSNTTSLPPTPMKTGTAGKEKITEKDKNKVKQ